MSHDKPLSPCLRLAALGGEMSGRYEDLEVWQLAMELVYAVYEFTDKFPDNEKYGLVTQMRRAAVSVASNIAEGKGRSTDKDFTLFLCHSRGSVYELQTQIMIAKHHGFVPEHRAADLKSRSDRVGRMLNGLIAFTSRPLRKST